MPDEKPNSSLFISDYWTSDDALHFSDVLDYKLIGDDNAFKGDA